MKTYTKTVKPFEIELELGNKKTVLKATVTTAKEVVTFLQEAQALEARMIADAGDKHAAGAAVERQAAVLAKLYDVTAETFLDNFAPAVVSEIFFDSLGGLVSPGK